MMTNRKPMGYCPGRSLIPFESMVFESTDTVVQRNRVAEPTLQIHRMATRNLGMEKVAKT